MREYGCNFNKEIDRKEQISRAINAIDQEMDATHPSREEFERIQSIFETEFCLSPRLLRRLRRIYNEVCATI